MVTWRSLFALTAHPTMNREKAYGADGMGATYSSSWWRPETGDERNPNPCPWN